jgi:lambda repressor-like predicted transcriptional regulator
MSGVTQKKAGSGANAVVRFDVDEFRDDIRAYLKRQGLTMREMSRRAGLDDTTVSSFLSHTTSRHILMTTAAALAHVADLSLDSYVVVN